MKSRKRREKAKAPTKEQKRKARVLIESGKLWKESSGVEHISSTALRELREANSDIKRIIKYLEKVNFAIQLGSDIRGIEEELAASKEMSRLVGGKIKELKKSLEERNYFQNDVNLYKKTVGEKLRANMEAIEELLKKKKKLREEAEKEIFARRPAG